MTKREKPWQASITLCMCQPEIISLDDTCLGGKDGKEMIWYMSFSILQIDRSHMLWQLATETDAPIRAVAKHGPKKGAFLYNFNFIWTDFKEGNSPMMILLHIRHDHFAYSTSTHIPKVFTHPSSNHLKTQKGVKSTRLWLSFLEVMNLLCSKRVLKLFESCHLGRSFQKKTQKSFCDSPILQIIPLPVIYNQFIWSNFNIYLDIIIYFWWTLDRFRSMGPILGRICTSDNRALVLHIVVQLLGWDLCNE